MLPNGFDSIVRKHCAFHCNRDASRRLVRVCIHIKKIRNFMTDSGVVNFTQNRVVPYG